MVLRGKDTYGTTALVLSPTRELAAQTAAVLQELAYFTNFRVYLLIGGTDTAKQAAQLRTEPDIIIGNPRAAHRLSSQYSQLFSRHNRGSGFG